MGKNRYIIYFFLALNYKTIYNQIGDDYMLILAKATMAMMIGFILEEEIMFEKSMMKLSMEEII